MASTIVRIDEERGKTDKDQGPSRVVECVKWQYNKTEDLYYCDLNYSVEGKRYEVSLIGDSDTEEIEVNFNLEGLPVMTFVYPTTDFRQSTYWVAFKHAAIIL